MIQFTDQDAGFKIANKTRLKQWLKTVALSEKKNPGTITYIFCSDDYLSEMNSKYLKHKTLTDIITFDYSDGKVISGDIFISIERVKENAGIFKTPFEDELRRVIVHGILHLTGAEDKLPEQKAEMRRLEDKYLLLWNAENENNG